METLPQIGLEIVVQILQNKQILLKSFNIQFINQSHDNKCRISDDKCFSTVFKSLVRPHIEYANQVWSPYLTKHNSS